MRAGIASPERQSFCREYYERGFIILREFFEREKMAVLDQEAQELLADDRRLISPRNLRCRYMPHHSTGEKLFECFDPVIDIAPQMEFVARDERLLNVLRSIYGQPAHLFKDKLIFKPAGAVGYPLHQDYISWPNFPQSFITVVIPLDDVHEGNGCTVVYEGYHQQGLLTPADGKFHPVPSDLVDDHRRCALIMKSGDVAIFHGFTPHQSNPNHSTTSRRQLYLSYNADDDGGDQRSDHYQKFHEWLREKYPKSEPDAWYFA